jgi:hypothetical protein
VDLAAVVVVIEKFQSLNCAESFSTAPMSYKQ